MNRLLLAALATLTIACDHEPVDAADVECSTGEATDDPGSSSSGEEPVDWDGAAVLVRTVSGGFNARCRDACGASDCVAALTAEGEPIACDQAGADNECTCSDLSEDGSGLVTHAVTECFAGTGSTRFSSEASKWAAGSCADFCGSFGFVCAGTVWGVDGECPDLGGTWDVDISGGVSADGRFVMLCAM